MQVHRSLSRGGPIRSGAEMMGEAQSSAPKTRRLRSRKVIASSLFSVAAVAGLVALPTLNASAATAKKLPSNIVIGTNALTTALGNPGNCNGGSTGAIACEPVYNALDTTTNGKLVGSLATSWKNISNTEYEFTLRTGVKFSDGEDFGVASVIASIAYYQAPAQASLSSFQRVSNIASVVAGSAPNTVDFNLKVSDPALPSKLSPIWMLPPTYLAAQGSSGFALHPVGTGPYTVVGNWSTNSVSFTRWSGSWEKGTVNSFTIEAIADDTARLQAFESGQIQVDNAMDFSQISTVKKAGGTVVSTKPSNTLALAFINTYHTEPAALQNPRIRYALNIAINRPAIIRTVYKGLTTAANQVAQTPVFGYDKALPQYAYNPTAAKAILKKNGYPNGFSFTATITPQFSAESEMWQAVAVQLQKIGVTLNLTSEPYANWVTQFVAGTFTTDAWVLSFPGPPQNDDSHTMTPVTCLQAHPEWCNASQTPIFNQANQTYDLALRLKLYAQLEKQMFNAPPAIFAVGAVDLAGVSKSIGSFGFTDDGSINFATIGK